MLDLSSRVDWTFKVLMLKGLSDSLVNMFAIYQVLFTLPFPTFILNLVAITVQCEFPKNFNQRALNMHKSSAIPKKRFPKFCVAQNICAISENLML